MELHIVDDYARSSEKWDRLIEQSPYASPFHTLRWLKLIEKFSGMSLKLLVGYVGQEPWGIIPLFVGRRGPFTLAFSPPPYLAIPQLGPILLNFDDLKQGKREHRYKEFVEGVDKYLKSRKVSYVFISLPLDFTDVRPFLWQGYVASTSYHYMVNTTEQERAWEALQSRLRREVSRKLQRQEIVVRQGDEEDIIKIYEDVVRRYSRQRKKLQVPLGYLLEAYKLFSDEILRVFVVEQSNKFRNGIVVYIFNRRAHIWFGAAHSEERASYNDVLHWKIIEWAGKSGLKELEIIGANTRDICEFKAKFNPELRLGFCVKKTSSTLVRIAESLYHVGHF